MCSLPSLFGVGCAFGLHLVSFCYFCYSFVVSLLGYMCWCSVCFVAPVSLAFLLFVGKTQYNGLTNEVALSRTSGARFPYMLAAFVRFSSACSNIAEVKCLVTRYISLVEELSALLAR